MVLGLFEPALAYLGQTAGLTRTSATNGALIMGLECVFVVILAALVLRERISRAIGGRHRARRRRPRRPGER